MKKLPKKIGEEIWMKINYIMIRFMKSKKGFKTDYNPKNVICTFKKVEGDEASNKINLIQIHVRTKVKDKWFGEEEDIDVDLYIPEEEFKKSNNL